MSMRVNSTCAHQLQSHEVDDTDRAPVTMDGDARGEQADGTRATTNNECGITVEGMLEVPCAEVLWCLLRNLADPKS